jgi:UDP-N-acetyl-D-galactosamine dehydrogenase
MPIHSFLGDRYIGVIGLGYVGLPLALELSKHFAVMGLDIDESRIEALRFGKDPSGNVADFTTNIVFSINFADLYQCKLVIVCVPTPTLANNDPDMGPLKDACSRISLFAPEGAIAVFESTVYPGATRECGQLIYDTGGPGIRVGYSPERVVPGDKNRQVKDVVKIVAGEDAEVLDLLTEVYSLIVEAGVHRAPSIEVAEASKLLENVQRDVNIALINEYSKYLRSLNVDTQDVLDAAKTKWNFLPFEPGLVGGHCIRDDPYYLLGSAKNLGVDVPLVTAAREVNESMSGWIAENALRLFVEHQTQPEVMKVLVLGLAFKENVGDFRNSKAADLALKLKSLNCDVTVCDPEINASGFLRTYGLSVLSIKEAVTKVYHCVVLAVKHDSIMQEFSLESVSSLLQDPRILVDIKSAYSRKEAKSWGIKLWRL